MKSSLVLSVLLMISTYCFAQKSCCEKTASTETFAMLTHNEKFVATHLDPLPFILLNPIGKEIFFNSHSITIGHFFISCYCKT